ncbi:MAG: cation:dicarboxylase symporter family transporter [Cryobacterium sp.]|nr:cation:dicarboxylase symporter family transporter [Oligoflexia bacterium]
MISARLRNSLPAQILLGAALGLLVGSFLPAHRADSLGEIGKLVIHWVKLVAGPFLFLTVLSAVIRVHVSLSHALRLVGIAVLNTACALFFAVSLSLLFFRGAKLPFAEGEISAAPATTPPLGISLGLDGWIKTFSPSSLFSPFFQNDILLTALLAVLGGIAVRKSGVFSALENNRIADWIEKIRDVFKIILHWLMRLIPFAVFAVLSSTVANHGFGVFGHLSKFVIVVFAAFALQITFVYGTWIRGIAKMPLREFWSAAKGPVLYSFGVNSSLATLPQTLLALKKLKISDRSASLGAGVATNLNNDGIVLYEAMAVFFIAFSHGIPMDVGTMVLAALTCVVAAMGITGIPEAGFISLSVVIGVLGLPAEMLPLLLAVDWVVARFRSSVNVLSDLTLSIAMDATEPSE